MEKDEGRLDSSAKFVQKGVSCRKQFVHEIRGSKRDHMVTLAATNFILFYLVDEKFVAPSVTRLLPSCPVLFHVVPVLGSLFAMQCSTAPECSSVFHEPG